MIVLKLKLHTYSFNSISKKIWLNYNKNGQFINKFYTILNSKIIFNFCLF